MFKKILLSIILLLFISPLANSSYRVEDVNYSYSYGGISSFLPSKTYVRKGNKRNHKYTYVREEPTYGSHYLVNTAAQYLGRNPTKYRSLWCADFINFVLAKNGHKTTGSRAARSFHTYGHPSTGKVGDIAISSRGRRGGHVGLVAGTCDDGKIKLLSGNFGRQKVGYGCYPKNRFTAFRSVA